MTSIREQLVTQMRAEVRAMTSHALGTGIAVPAWALAILARVNAGSAQPPEGADAVQDTMFGELARAHAELSKLVAPATPELMVMLYKDSDDTRLRQTFGQARIVRSFMAAAMLSLAIFILVSISPYLNEPKYGDFFSSSGFPLFVNELFYISSAAMGASFSSLFQVNRAITNGTLLPKNEASYWVQFSLGIVAGLLMSTVLNLSTVAPQDDRTLTSMNLTGAVLALLGGFSASVVEKVLKRLIDALETVVKGSGEAEIQIREQTGKLRIEETLAKERMRTSLLLNDVQRRLAAGESPEGLLRLLDQASQKVLSNDGQPLPPPEPPPPAVEGAAKPSAPALEVRAVIEAENGAPLAGLPYEIHREGQVVAAGHSDAKGEIVYPGATPGEHEILLFQAATKVPSPGVPSPGDVAARHARAAFHAARRELARGVQIHGEDKPWETNGVNRGPVVDEYIKPFMSTSSAPPWCGMFVGYSYLKAGFKEAGQIPASQTTDGRPVARKSMFLSAPRLMLYLKGAGCPHVEFPTRKAAAGKLTTRAACAAWLDEKLKPFAPRPGDILLCHTATGDYAHVGMVASYDPSTYELVTYEGNYGNRAAAWRWDLADPSDTGFFRVNMIGRLKLEDFEGACEVPPEGPSPEPAVQRGGVASAR